MAQSSNNDKMKADKQTLREGILHLLYHSHSGYSPICLLLSHKVAFRHFGRILFYFIFLSQEDWRLNLVLAHLKSSHLMAYWFSFQRAEYQS